jgi:flagellar hook-associated protein 2
LAAGTAAGTTSEVVLDRDPAALATSVKALVDAVNSAIADIDTHNGYNATTRTSGALAGDSGLRALRTQLLSTVFPGDGTSLADLGIQTDRSGKLVFDESAFREAYTADPAGVQARMTTDGTGFAARVKSVAGAASNAVDGTVTSAITGRNEAIRRLDDSISSWDLRLELRRTALTRQFTALESALSQMNSQSSWLSGQINSLSAGEGS